MKKSFYSFLSLLLVILLVACGSKSNKNTSVETPRLTPPIAQQDEVITVQDSVTVNIPIKNGVGSITLSKKERQNALISFDSQSYTHLNGKITSSDSVANVRFTQITMPDGSMDGPFWNEITYDLPQKGMHKISLGENMMAGDPWSGIFTVELKLNR